MTLGSSAHGLWPNYGTHICWEHSVVRYYQLSCNKIGKIWTPCSKTFQIKLYFRHHTKPFRYIILQEKPTCFPLTLSDWLKKYVNSIKPNKNRVQKQEIYLPDTFGPLQCYCMQNYKFWNFWFAVFWLVNIHFLLFYL